MPAPVIYRSTDTNAPVLFGGPGSLISLLDAILVNGYGSAFAVGIITSDGTAPSAGDTVTVGSQTYTFQSTVTAQPPNTVQFSSVSGSLTNLAAAINATWSVATGNVSTGTQGAPEVWASYPGNGNVITIFARKGGSAGNSIALARASAGTPHLSVSGATLTGGGGSDTKAGAGWTKPYSGSPSSQQAVYRQPAGSRFYLQVDDSGPGAGGGREARCFGFEAMTAYNVGSGQFPTPAQVAAGCVIRKSLSLDNVVRPWIAFTDDRTFYLFTSSGDQAGNYHGFSFGDFYSFINGDVYKCLIMSGSNETAGVAGVSTFGVSQLLQVGVSQIGHWLPRNASGFGGSTNFAKASDYAPTTGNNYMVGTIGFPNVDGGVYLAPLRIGEGSNPSTSILGTVYLRGRVRGIYQICHPVASLADGDVINGIGAYAGRTFQVVKYIFSSTSSVAFCAIETTNWAASA
jgi:hypothetical protein